MHRLMTQHSEETKLKNKKMRDWFELKEKKTSAGEKREVTNEERDCKQREKKKEQRSKKAGELA